MTKKIMAAIATLCGLGLAQATPAHAWPVVAYDQFDGTFSATCSDPVARFNVVVGTARIVDGTPEKLVAVPMSWPLDVHCDSGPIEADIDAQVRKLEELCAENRWSLRACDQFLSQLEKLQGLMTAALPPVVDSVTFDWRANGFTWLFGVNVSDTILHFAETATEVARTAVLNQSLLRGNKRIPVLDADGAPVLDKNGNPKRKWLVDPSRGVYMNFVESATEYKWTPSGDLAEFCSGGMAVHSSGEIQVGDDGTTATGVIDSLRSVNCAFPIDSENYLGISISTRVDYEWSGAKL